MEFDTMLSGGCACKRIRYEITDEAILCINCHCRECQRASGSAYAAIMVIWKAALNVSRGELSYYSRDAEGGDFLQRGFCSFCGSPIAMTRASRPKLAYILAGSLDSPESFVPTMNIFTAEAHEWDVLDAQLDNYPGMPPVPDELGR